MRNVGSSWTYRKVDEGQLRVAQGRYAEGLALLEPIMRISPYGEGRLYQRAHENIALSRRALGNLNGAIEALEPLGATRAAVVTYRWAVDDWLRTRVLLAELYQEAGRREDAARVAAEVRKLLAIADNGHPLLARLRRVDP